MKRGEVTVWRQAAATAFFTKGTNLSSSRKKHDNEAPPGATNALILVLLQQQNCLKDESA